MDECSLTGDHLYREGSASCRLCGRTNYAYLGYLSGVARRAKRDRLSAEEDTRGS